MGTRARTLPPPRSRSSAQSSVVQEDPLDLAQADPQNRPVRLTLRASKGVWHLRADAAQPHPQRVIRGAYHYTAHHPAPLRALVRRYVVPLYRAFTREATELGAGLVLDALLF